MSNGLRRSTGRSHKDKILLGCVLLRDVRRLWKLLRRRILGAPLLRLSSLFEGDVVVLNLEAVPII
jgi:hypothetical protein